MMTLDATDPECKNSHAADATLLTLEIAWRSLLEAEREVRDEQIVTLVALQLSVEDSIVATPAGTLTGLSVKARLVAWYAAHDAVSGKLADSLVADCEHLAAKARNKPAPAA